MTPQAQQIAIAEACGWGRFGMYSRIASGKQLLGSGDALHGTPPEDGGMPEDDQRFLPVPRYLESLDAMHEAEKMLTPAYWDTYTRLLADFPRTKGGVHTTAAQRAEALLKTLNLWDDTK